MLIIIIYKTNIKHTFIGSMFYHKKPRYNINSFIVFIVKTPKD